MRSDEEARLRNEFESKQEQKRHYFEESQRLDAEIHSLYLTKQLPKFNLIETPKQQLSINKLKKGHLIDSRTQFFEQKVAELNIQLEKPLTKPKNFKYQVLFF